MKGEIKLSGAVSGKQLPNAYSAGSLHLGEFGAIAVYEQNDETNTATIRFSSVDSPLPDSDLKSLSSNVQALLTSYLGVGVEYVPVCTCSGELKYTFFATPDATMLRIGIVLGSTVIATAHYMGITIQDTTPPTNIEWFTENQSVKDSLLLTVTTVMKAVINKELYG